MKTEQEKASAPVSEEPSVSRPAGIWGKHVQPFSEKAKQAVAKAQHSLAAAADRNGDGKIDAEDFGLTRENLQEAGETVKGLALAAGHGLKSGGQAVGQALADTRLELDRKNLRPVFPADLWCAAGQAAASAPGMIALVARDKKRSESAVCQGSVGYYLSVKGYDLLNVYADCAAQLGVSFYPNAAQDVYLADPYRKNCYIAAGEYFDFLRKAMVNELETVAQDLGAKQVCISFKEHKRTNVSRHMRGDAKAASYHETAARNTTLDEISSVEIAADLTFSGNNIPVKPELVYFQQESDICKLVQMRTSTSANRIESKVYRFQCSRLYGIKEEAASQISTVLHHIKCSGGISFTQSAQRESRTELEYHITF